MRLRILSLAASGLLFCAAAADAQPVGSYFALIVNDIDVSMEWYEEVLGLEVGTRMTESGRYDIANLQKPGIFVELLELAEAGARPQGRVEGPFKVGLLVNDVSEFVEGLPDSIATPEVIDDPANSLRFVQLRDPDGNIVQVMEVVD